MPCSLAQSRTGEHRKSHSLTSRLKTLFNGFALSDKEQVLPYVSLEDWFDPYLGLKVQHRSPFDDRDTANHHLKFASTDDYSWKFRYIADSISDVDTQQSLLFKLKQDSDTYFYGIGNETEKTARQLATYYSMFIGGELRQHISKRAALLWSPGIWDFQSGLADGQEFEKASDALYLTSRFTLSDIRALSFWEPAMNHRWSSYAEFGMPLDGAAAFYSRFNVESVAQVSLFLNTKLRLNSRLEFVVSPDRSNVPYFALPEIGSSNGLRAFSKERFRNFALLAVNLEYAFPLTSNLDGFLLADFARTASVLSDLSAGAIHKDFGIGLRLHNVNYPISVGIATGDEGAKAFWSVAVGSAW